MINFLWILFFITLGLITETVVKRRVLSQHFQIDTNTIKEMNPTDRFKASAANELPDIIGLGLFFGTSYIAFFLFDKTNSSLVQLTFHAVLITISLIRTGSILSKLFLSPGVDNFRILPFGTQVAKNIHRLIITTFAYIATALMFSAIVHRLGGEQESVLLLQLFFATLLLGVTAIAILIFRYRIRNYILAGDETAPDEGWGRKQFASVWHLLAILYLALLWVLLIADIASPRETTKGAFLLSFFVVPLWMITDKVVQRIVSYTMSSLKIHQNHYNDKEEVSEEILLARQKGKRLYIKMKSFAQTGVVVALAIWIAGLWQIQIPYISTLAAALLDSVIILTLALIFWQFISSWIERKIQESLPEEEEDENKSDDEWGGAASRGRSYTLLPMIRKFIASVLIVMVTLTILSSIGVDIGPLLAGAGVVGLAVGFGAQKLVSDMFSGFFYLLDDAFRVGEYLTAGSVSGTVESITLRNVMLRHHRGMLQIVPHSELGAITNFMRGGMIVKFNLDFPYDANIDKIRKIIKKVGIAMLDDEEIGKDFIRPVKSQGVREITNSVMTIRVKFTAQPGTHFVIRREAFKRITEALSAAGIHYAHKKVIVDVPGLREQDGDKKLSPEQAKTITDTVGAAAFASLDQEIKEEEEQGQPG